MKKKHIINALREEVQMLTDLFQLSTEMSTLINETKDLNLKRTEYHLSMVKQTTGEILMEDVTYCVNLSSRIIKHMGCE